jgi:MFS family permease
MWELKTEYPLIDVRFFRLAGFSTGCLVVAMQYFFTFGIAFAITQYLQLVLRYSALKAGFALMPSAAVVMVVAPVGGRAFGRFGAAKVTSVGLVVMALGGCALVSVRADTGYWPVFAALMLSSLAIGIVAAGTTSMVMSALPAHQSGMASGAQSATRQLGGALGVAIVGSLLQVRYASALTHSLSNTAGRSLASTAKRSLAVAVNLPHTPAPLRQLIARLGRLAFIDAVDLVGIVLAILALVGALVVPLLLRGERRFSGAPTEGTAVPMTAPSSPDK